MGSWEDVGDDVTDGVVVHDAGVPMQESSLELEAVKVANTCNTLGIRDPGCVGEGVVADTTDERRPGWDVHGPRAGPSRCNSGPV